MSHSIVHLISDGIDSPVAAHLMGEAGADVKLLNLDLRPFTHDSTISAVDDIIERLKELHPGMEAYRASFEKIHKNIIDRGDEKYRCIICRRMMYRAGEEFLKRKGGDAIATGESLGQVASQTLSNITSEDDAVNSEIFRPLIGLDKNETISIARDIGTYEISTQPTVCCLITPDRPRVDSGIKDVNKKEENMPIQDLLDSLSFEEL